MRRGLRVGIASLLLMSIPLFAMQPVAGPVREGGFVGFVQQQALPYATFDRWPGLRARVLSEDTATGRLAIYAEFPANWHGKALPALAQSVDIVIVDGALQFDSQTLAPMDFAFVPPGSTPPVIASAGTSHALLFFDPPAPDADAVRRQRERGPYVTHFDEARWQGASLARQGGPLADLRIFHLKKDPFTSARTWYVKLDGGRGVPWEVHSMVEEGYVMRGDYRLAECLPTRTVIGDYAAGGYFWRPGGIAHSGPESGTQHGIVWLQRTQVALDVTLYQQCQDGKALEPLVR